MRCLYTGLPSCFPPPSLYALLSLAPHSSLPNLSLSSPRSVWYPILCSLLPVLFNLSYSLLSHVVFSFIFSYFIISLLLQQSLCLFSCSTRPVLLSSPLHVYILYSLILFACPHFIQYSTLISAYVSQSSTDSLMLSNCSPLIWRSSAPFSLSPHPISLWLLFPSTSYTPPSLLSTVGFVSSNSKILPRLREFECKWWIHKAPDKRDQMNEVSILSQEFQSCLI